MKRVYAHRTNHNDEVICVATTKFRCTAPLGVLDPQPLSGHDVSNVLMTRQVHIITLPEIEPTHEEPSVPEEDAVVVVFTEADLEDDDVFEDVDELKLFDDINELDELSEVSGEVTAPASDEDEYERYTTDELFTMCADLGVKPRKNATRASLIKIIQSHVSE